MAWFQKFLGLGKKENTVLTLKLRLNRWRHFLRTEWTCARLLDDLTEKSRGEYIFDRQYVYSTVGRIFQHAFQVAYDGSLLLRNPERELYDWLDQQKDKTLSYLSQYSKGMSRSDSGPSFQATPSAENSRGGDPWEPELNLDQEPEFRMLKGVIAMLEGEQGQERKSAAKKLEEVADLRRALRWAHEKVLGELISPEIIRQWVETGLAVPWGEKLADSYFVIDLGRESMPGINPPKVRKSPIAVEKALTTWPMIQEVLTALIQTPFGDGEKKGRSLCFIIDENALFLYGVHPEAIIWLDMVVTNVRELNHVLFRWQKGSEERPAGLKTLPSWEWTYQVEGKVYEFVAFQKPPREMVGYGELVGRAWALG